MKIIRDIKYNYQYCFFRDVFKPLLYDQDDILNMTVPIMEAEGYEFDEDDPCMKHGYLMCFEI